MNWIIISILGLLGTGFFNLSMAAGGKPLPKGLHSKVVYFCLIIIFGGLLSFAILAFMYLKHKTSTLSVYKKMNYSLAILPAIFLIGGMIATLWGFETGPGVGVVSGIVNLNTLVTLFGGVILFGDKINIKIILSMIIGLLGISYAGLEAKKIANL